MHAQTLVNKPEGELSICERVGRSRGYTITEGITRGLLFWFCYNPLLERGHVTALGWVHSLLLLRSWKAVTGRLQVPEKPGSVRNSCQSPCQEAGEAVTQPRARRARPAQPPPGSHSTRGSTRQVGAIQTPWNQKLSPLGRINPAPHPWRRLRILSHQNVNPGAPTKTSQLSL